MKTREGKMWFIGLVTIFLLEAMLSISAMPPQSAYAGPEAVQVTTWTSNIHKANGPCGMTDRFQPCPLCEVWVNWGDITPSPDVYKFGVRLDGTVTSGPDDCQIFNVTNYVIATPDEGRE